MSLDLGTLALGLGQEYIRQRWGARQQPAGFFDIPGVDIEADIPFVDIARERPRRRRRRRLLTDRDFMDLASLKTLTGNSDAFKAAVVKSVRR